MIKKIIILSFTALLFFGDIVPAIAKSGYIRGTNFYIQETRGRISRESDRYRYQYYITLTPHSSHANLQRIEYVGFCIKRGSGASYFQIFPDGTYKQITDTTQALYTPSQIIDNPKEIGRYKLLPKPIETPLSPGGSITTNEHQSGWYSQEISFWAGYGYLTQENLDLIKRQKELENNPVIKSQITQVSKLSIQQMKWSLAQSNMMENKNYYQIFKIKVMKSRDGR